MDRQDIDALLIGALYGELTPADEARLATHLESHPADRGALDDLKVARQAVLDSRIFAVQLEPPQAVSALLLQEAHRRAPKKVVATDGEQKDGWFARFARNFMAHPAMAAAAMLVLVMGGAGIVWMKKGDQFASSEYSQTNVRAQSEAAPATATTAPTPEPVLPEGNAAVAAGSAYSADLYDDGKPIDGADQGNARFRSADEQRAQLERDVANKQAEIDSSRRELSKAKSGAMEVNTDRAPKDFESRKGKSDSAADDAIAADKVAAPKPAQKVPATAGLGGGGGAGVAGGTYGTGTGSAAAGAAPGRAGDSTSFDMSGGETSNAISGAGYSQPPLNATPPPAAGSAPAKKSAAPTTTPTTTAAPKTGAKVATDSKVAAPTTKTVSKTTKPSPKAAPEKPAEPPASIAAAPVASPDPAPPPAPTKEAPAKNESKKDEGGSTLLAWAKAEHQRAVGLAKGGNCSAAAKIALSVSNRASSYYSQYMATDRSLKACAQYINAERDKEAERTQKARASKRVNADEPASSESTK